MTSVDSVVFEFDTLDPWSAEQREAAGVMSSQAYLNAPLRLRRLFLAPLELVQEMTWYPNGVQQDNVPGAFWAGMYLRSWSWQRCPAAIVGETCDGPRGHVTDHAFRIGGGLGIATWPNFADVDDSFDCERCSVAFVDDYRATENVIGLYDVCHICVAQMRTCYDCDRRVADGHFVHTSYGYALCSSCMDSRYMHECENCGLLFNADDTYTDYCEGCEEEHQEEEGSQYLNDYSFRPDPVFHGEGRVYLGWELETEVGRGHDIEGAAREIISTAGEVVYLKEDSSINRGFEVVSHPMTHEFARQTFPWKVLNSMSEAGCFTQSENNGLHVHVNRAAFDSPSHVYRWLKFLYRNAPSVTRIARRDSGMWASWGNGARDYGKNYAKGERGGDRYSAVNVCNRQTFEVRVFAASLHAHEIMAALDLVHASVEYTRTLTSYEVNRGGWGWKAFETYLRDREDIYSGILLVLSETAPPDNDVVPIIPAKNVKYRPRVTPVPPPGEEYQCECPICAPPYGGGGYDGYR